MARARADDVTLEIPRPRDERLRQVIEGTGFHSVTECRVHVLRDQDERRLRSEEVAAARQRSQSLGYLED
jgi:hypothetical protein